MWPDKETLYDFLGYTTYVDGSDGYLRPKQPRAPDTRPIWAVAPRQDQLDDDAASSSRLPDDPVPRKLEERPSDYAVVARLTAPLKRLLAGLSYERANPRWEGAEDEYRSHGWPKARRIVEARRLIDQNDAQATLFAMGRYLYRAWVTNMTLTPAGVWHFYDGRAAIEPRIHELREDFALRKIPTGSFEANALYLEVIRLAYNLVTAFQRTCLPESLQSTPCTDCASSCSCCTE